MDGSTLRGAFLGALAEPRRAAFADDALDARLDTLCARGRAAWPDVALDGAAFVAHVAQLIRDGDELEALCAGDVWLACACARGDAAALRALEAVHVRGIEAVLARLKLDADVLAEAKQLVRHKLLVGPPPRIAEYSGRGELRSWLHAVATRTALNLLRSRRRELRADDDHLLSLPAAAADPETALLRERYSEEFKRAFGEALASLTPRQRVLIKRHFIDGVGTEGLGALYHVHRVTVLRWLTDTRELLAKRTQAALWRRLGMQRAEFESVVRLVQSQLDYSIRTMLGAEGITGA